MAAVPVPPPVPVVLGIPELRTVLGCGERVARRVAHEIGCRVGGRRLGVTREELARYLARRVDAGANREAP